MTIIKFHNAIFKGIHMPSSAEDGYLFANDIDTVGTLGSISQDDGSTLIFEILNRSGLTDLEIDYSAVGETVTVNSLKYYLNTILIMEFIDVDIVGSKEALRSGDLLSTRITTSNDTIGGSGYGDTLFGGPGDDQIFGDAGNDFISGDAHDDTLYGMTGNDKLFGGFGADVLNGGPGIDAIYGGPGSDLFLFDELDDKVTIKDFNRKDDSLTIDKGLARNFKQLKSAVEQYKNGIKFDFRADDLLLLEGLNVNKLKKIDLDFSHL